MRNNKEYSQAIAQAKENLTDLNERGEDAVGGNVLEFMESILTPDEIAESELRVSIIGELIKARQVYGDNSNIISEEIPELLSYMEDVMPKKEFQQNMVSNLLDTAIDIGRYLPKTSSDQ